METNKIDIDRIQEKIGEINELSERAKSSLKNMDSLIENTVNNGKGVWDGESARAYKEQWHRLAEEIPEFTDIFEKQSKNLSSIVEHMKKTETE